MHPFRQYIERYTHLPAQEWQKIQPLLQPIKIPTGYTLLEEGKQCRHLYFLENGLLRFFVWRDGKDITKFFTTAPYCFTSQRSFTQEVPATENIEALTNSTLWSLDRRAAFDLLENPAWSTFVRQLVQEVQFYTEQILEEIQQETAEQRYRKMLFNGDPLLQEVPLKHLASYFGIAPQSLSRIRKKIFQEART
ncbi:MAG: Crp/Fnr family transcriptional regulator [Saprospiraceae bacterium]|nr:Crp/Fnr family transcriptional regulator [Saprospiraceae bacterium]